MPQAYTKLLPYNNYISCYESEGGYLVQELIYLHVDKNEGKYIHESYILGNHSNQIQHCLLHIIIKPGVQLKMPWAKCPITLHEDVTGGISLFYSWGETSQLHVFVCVCLTPTLS